MATAISPRVIRKTGASTPKLEAAREFPCDLCGSREAVEVPHAREYTNGQPMHICTHCGFVYVRRRRSASRIAEVWSEDLFGANYTAAIPAVKARLTYVAEFLDQSLGLRNKRVCDIGAGEGVFLDLIRQERYGASVFGIEASRNRRRPPVHLKKPIWANTERASITNTPPARTSINSCRVTTAT